MSVSVSPATMAAICALLRALLLESASWLARYLALWPARLGHCAFGLTPVTPWQPAQVADFALAGRGVRGEGICADQQRCGES